MRNVLITGVGGGLGLVVAKRFAEDGDQIYGCDLSPRAIEAIKATGLLALAEVINVARRTEVERLFAAVWAMTDHIDILINNVGVAGPRASLDKIEPDDWTNTLDANLNAAFWTMRAVLPRMKQRGGGVILNVSTGSVKTLPEWRAPYTVSKAALEALTLAVAREAGPFDVRCNAVQPGMMDNERLALVMSRVAQQSGRSLAEVEAEQLRFVSMRSKVSMEEVAAMLHYLASDPARHVTGQIIAVDAGIQWEG